MDETRFLDSIGDDAYREALRELLDVCRGLGLSFGWGTTGTSIRVLTPDSPVPISVGWLFPTEGSYWTGLRGFNLGFDPGSAGNALAALPGREEYLLKVGALPGAEPVKTKSLRAYHLGPDATVCSRRQIAEIIAELVRRVNREQEA